MQVLINFLYFFFFFFFLFFFFFFFSLHLKQGGVYLASQDANKAIDEKCASVVTIMSDRGWHELFKCNKYSGEAVRWDSNFQEHVTAVGTMGMYSFNESAVGEETYWYVQKLKIVENVSNCVTILVVIIVIVIIFFI